MSAFQDMVAADIKSVFLNLEEFGQRRTIRYDGETYQDIPVVLTGIRERGRRKLEDDHAQGIYQTSAVLHCAMEDLNGNQPERGHSLSINDEAGGYGFFRDFTVTYSVCEMGMLRVELEAMDE